MVKSGMFLVVCILLVVGIERDERSGVVGLGGLCYEIGCVCLGGIYSEVKEYLIICGGLFIGLMIIICGVVGLGYGDEGIDGDEREEEGRGEREKKGKKKRGRKKKEEKKEEEKEKEEEERRERRRREEEEREEKKEVLMVYL